MRVLRDFFPCRLSFFPSFPSWTDTRCHLQSTTDLHTSQALLSYPPTYLPIERAVLGVLARSAPINLGYGRQAGRRGEERDGKCAGHSLFLLVYVRTRTLRRLYRQIAIVRSWLTASSLYSSWEPGQAGEHLIARGFLAGLSPYWRRVRSFLRWFVLLLRHYTAEGGGREGGGDSRTDRRCMVLRQRCARPPEMRGEESRAPG